MTCDVVKLKKAKNGHFLVFSEKKMITKHRKSSNLMVVAPIRNFQFKFEGNPTIFVATVKKKLFIF